MQRLWLVLVISCTWWSANHAAAPSVIQTLHTRTTTATKTLHEQRSLALHTPTVIDASSRGLQASASFKFKTGTTPQQSQPPITDQNLLLQIAQNFVKTIQASRRHLLAAAAARFVSIFVMYPIDTLKTRSQMGNGMGSLSLGGLYKGVQGSLVGQIPYGVLTFGSYEMYKQALLNKYQDTNIPPAFLYAMAAIMGDVTGSGWLCPSEVVKQQMQGGLHSSTRKAIVEIWKKNGVRGFYQGYFGALARDVPFRVAQLVSYEVFKSVFLSVKEKKQYEQQNGAKRGGNAIQMSSKIKLSGTESALCGAIAGTFSSAITTPLDRIKTLLMTQSNYGTNVASCAASIWQKDGMVGFFKGLVPRVVYIAPSVAIFFTVYEAVQQRLVVVLEEEE